MNDTSWWLLILFEYCSCLQLHAHVFLRLFNRGLTLILLFLFQLLGVSVTSSNTGVPDISGSVYTKTQVSVFATLLNLFRTCTTKWHRIERVVYISILSNCFLFSIVFREAGFPHRDPQRFLQFALGTRERRPHQPSGRSSLCTGPVHAHPDPPSAAPLPDAPPPPATGWTGKHADGLNHS